MINHEFPTTEEFRGQEAGRWMNEDLYEECLSNALNCLEIA